MGCCMKPMKTSTSDLDKWTPDYLKQWVVEGWRARYQLAARTLKELELANRDARVKGVSFKERERLYGAKIRGGYQCVAEYTRKGKEATRAEPWLFDYISVDEVAGLPEQEVIKRLEYAVFGYPLPALGGLALSPVKV